MEAITLLHYQLQQSTNELENIENLVLQKEKEISDIKTDISKEKQQLKSLNDDITKLSGDLDILKSEYRQNVTSNNVLEFEKLLLSGRMTTYSKLSLGVYWKCKNEIMRMLNLILASYVKWNVASKLSDLNILKEEYKKKISKIQQDYLIEECTLEMQISDEKEKIENMKTFIVNNALFTTENIATKNNKFENNIIRLDNLKEIISTNNSKSSISTEKKEISCSQSKLYNHRISNLSHVSNQNASNPYLQEQLKNNANLKDQENRHYNNSTNIDINPCNNYNRKRSASQVVSIYNANENNSFTSRFIYDEVVDTIEDND